MDVKFHRNENYPMFLRGKIVAVCELLLKEKLGVIAGSRELVALGSELFDKHDEDFLPFVAIDSETDHLPAESVRPLCASAWLNRCDLELEEVERVHGSSIRAACERLVGRYGSSI